MVTSYECMCTRESTLVREREHTGTPREKYLVRILRCVRYHIPVVLSGPLVRRPIRTDRRVNFFAFSTTPTFWEQTACNLSKA